MKVALLPCFTFTLCDPAVQAHPALGDYPNFLFLASRRIAHQNAPGRWLNVAAGSLRRAHKPKAIGGRLPRGKDLASHHLLIGTVTLLSFVRHSTLANPPFLLTKNPIVLTDRSRNYEGEQCILFSDTVV